MDNCSLPHKKRRHDGSFQPKYHSRYKDGDEGRDWRKESYRDEARFMNRAVNSKENDLEINLIGQKVAHPMFHVCETCSLPIRSYGRMIPCKHVFCFSCAKKTDNNCPRCKDAVQRIEQCPLGSVFLCLLIPNCRRTYLSQRDLQAHINHRHKTLVLPPPVGMPPVSMPPPNVGLPAVVPPNIPPPNVAPPNLPPPNAPPPTLAPSTVPLPNVPPPNMSVPPPTLIRPAPPISAPYLLVSRATSSSPSAPPVVQPAGGAPRPTSNLITVQIQDESRPPPPPPCRPLNQPQLYPPQSQPASYQ